jgi:hypothetical protein
MELDHQCGLISHKSGHSGKVVSSAMVANDKEGPAAEEAERSSRRSDVPQITELQRRGSEETLL